MKRKIQTINRRSPHLLFIVNPIHQAGGTTRALSWKNTASTHVTIWVDKLFFIGKVDLLTYEKSEVRFEQLCPHLELIKGDGPYKVLQISEFTINMILKSITSQIVHCFYIKIF